MTTFMVGLSITAALFAITVTYTVQSTQAEAPKDHIELQFATASKFHSTWSKVSPHPSETVFASIFKHYGEPHRKYHNLSHIDFCLAELSRMQIDDDSRNQIELALWFHDIIYDPRAKDNERKSAELFQNFANEGELNAKLIKTVSMMIEATETHQVPPEQDNFTTRLFLDLDLSILGTDETSFQTYDQGIRAEYKWVPEILYRLGRSKILKKFLNRPTIYFTSEFQKLYETKARHNLTQSIKNLTKP